MAPATLTGGAGGTGHGARVAVLTCELGHRHTAQHLGPCLLVDDLRRAGHRVWPVLCHADTGTVDQLARALRARAEAGELDLVAVDSLWPLAAVKRLREAAPGVPFVVGGLNAFATFLGAELELAIVGPARQALATLAGELAADPAGPRRPGWRSRAPNLFFRTDGGRVDHSGHDLAWDATRELRPFSPHLDWEYLGPPRDPAATYRELSVVPELGCYHRLSPDHGSPAALYRDARHPGFGERLTAAAAARVAAQLADNRGGCTFCVFRWQSYAVPPRPEAIALVVEQVRHYASLGVRELSLQSEDPFRLLGPALDALEREGLMPSALALRSTPAALLRAEGVLRRLLARAAAGRAPRLRLQQIGFESFVQADLDLFNKGISADDNRRAARLLVELGREFPSCFEGTRGHGLILFHPFCTLEGLAENLRAIEADAPFLARRATLDARLTLYSELSPIALLAEQRGLLRRRPDVDFGLDYDYADERVAQLRAVVGAMTEELALRLARSRAAGRLTAADHARRFDAGRAGLLRLAVRFAIDERALDDRFIALARDQLTQLAP